MSLTVVAIAISLLTIPALVTNTSLSAPAQVRTTCLAAMTGLLLLGAGTLLAASPLVMWWHDGPTASHPDVAHLSPGGQGVWVVSGLAAGLGARRVVVALRRTTRARRRAVLPRWAADSCVFEQSAGAEVRVAPTLEPVAFAVPGRDRHIVVSRAVMNLPEPERRAVLAHEGAHLRLRHDRHLLVLSTYEYVWGWLPGVRATVRRHRSSIEQWADTATRDTIGVAELTLHRARLDLSGDRVLPTVPVSLPTASRSSGWYLGGVCTVVGALVVAGGYSLTHTVGDLVAVLGALHYS